MTALGGTITAGTVYSVAIAGAGGQVHKKVAPCCGLCQINRLAQIFRDECVCVIFLRINKRWGVYDRARLLHWN